MPRYIAFLRAINVGGRTVPMLRLRELFTALGFSGVETFIASGNVIFETPVKSARTLEKHIEQKLQAEVGFVVATFIRTRAELAALAEYQPFPAAQLEAAQALNISFLASAPDSASRQKLLAMKNDIDDFHIHSREVYWLCRRKQSESKFSNARLEKTLGQPATLRGINTLRKMAEKYSF